MIFLIPLNVYNTRSPFNDPIIHDLDEVCIFIYTLDLPLVDGVMACTTNRYIMINDDDAFINWIHVIFDPIVVIIYGKNNEEQKKRPNVSSSYNFENTTTLYSSIITMTWF